MTRLHVGETRRLQAEDEGGQKKIFVGGLKNDIFEFQLTQYFSQYGQAEKSEIMKDMGTGRNRGFGTSQIPQQQTKLQIQGEDGTTPRVVEGNQNGYGSRNYPGNNTNGEYGGSHGAEYSDQGSPATDWRPVQGVPRLRPSVAGIGSGTPRPRKGRSGQEDGWMEDETKRILKTHLKTKTLFSYFSPVP
uniref:RRM domain-containing protein n=1 Tax=Oryzias melastigma TaxID=30732 RepID=A0A3B3CXI0_ORYME